MQVSEFASKTLLSFSEIRTIDSIPASQRLFTGDRANGRSKDLCLHIFPPTCSCVVVVVVVVVSFVCRIGRGRALRFQSFFQRRGGGSQSHCGTFVHPTPSCARGRHPTEHRRHTLICLSAGAVQTAIIILSLCPKTVSCGGKSANR